MAPAIPEFVDLLAERPVAAARGIAGDTDCHLVGGILRDRLLGRPSPDVDLVVAGDGLLFSRDLAARLDARLVYLGGARFSAFRIAGPEVVVDVWGRGDASTRSDLERRDLTLNAMALDLATGDLRDPFDGRRDLEHRVLRAVTSRSFSEDPLRVLRLARFASQLPSFSVEPQTIELARTSSEHLGRVAVERKREELDRIFSAGSPAASVDLLLRLGALQSLLRIDRVSIDHENRLIEALRRLEIFERRARAVLQRAPARDLCVHALVFRSLPVAGEDVTRLHLPQERLVTRRQAGAIGRLAYATTPPCGERPRAFLARWGDLWLEAAAVSSSLAPEESPDQTTGFLDEARSLLDAEGEAALDPRPLLNGHDVTALLGISEGPLVGRLLGMLRQAQIAGDIETRREAIASLPALLASARQQQ